MSRFLGHGGGRRRTKGALVGLKMWAKDTNPWLAAGAGLYWASYAFRIMNAEPVYAAAIGSGSSILEDVFMTLWVVVTFLACRRWGVRKARPAVCWVMVAASVLVAVCDLAQATLPLPTAVALSCLDLVTLGASMILWGLAFASLERHLAARNVVVAVLIAAALILVGQAASEVLSCTLMTCACTVGASLIMASGRVILNNHARSPLPRPRKQLAWLLVQRVAFGFSLGFFPTAAVALAQPWCDPVLLGFTLVVIAGSAVTALHSDEPPCTMLPALVLVACGTLCLPFLRAGGMACMFPSLFSAIWLSWQTLSSVQLSDLKVQFGLSELDVSFVDKLAIALTILSGTVACHLVEAALDMSVLPLGAVETLLPMAFCGLAITASFSLAQLVSVHQEDTFQGRIAQASAERESKLFASIADEFGLSSREHQVFAMLAQGHTSSFIAEAAGITAGTAKAHVAHIYQKLGVHSKDEMLELVESREAKMRA